MWIKSKVTNKKWTDYYSKIPGYTFLDADKDGVWMGYYGITLPEESLEITNTEELLRIKKHREAVHYYPQPEDLWIK